MQGMRSWRGLACGALACLLLAGGCGKNKGQDKRSTLEFHTGGAKALAESLRKELPRREYYGMMRSTELLGQNLHGVPDRVESHGTDRKEQRLAAAEKACELFDAYRPTLESLKYDEAEANAKLDELKKLLDQVDNP